MIDPTAASRAYYDVTRWLAVAIAIAVLFLALWIIVPAPTYFLLTFGVGGPEVSAWLIVASLVGIGLVVRDVQHSSLARFVVAACAVSFVLAASIFARLPSTLRRFESAMRDVSVTPAVPLRAHPLVVRDLFLGIPRVDARVTRGIPFAKPDGIPLALDVYQPMQTGTFPIVVQVYGGAWQRGDPTSHANFAKWLASSGYVVFAVDYRHAPKWKWPALLNDVDSSLAWIAQHGAEYGGDTSRVVLLGRSAGAHLAMLAAYRPSALRVRAVVSYYGPADLIDAYRNPPRPDPLHARELEEALIGGTPSQMPKEYAEASPITYATKPLPPTLLIYGRRDHSVESKYGARLGAQLAKTGTQVGYLEIPWAEHAFDEVFNGVSSQVALFYTERFLAWAVRSATADNGQRTTDNGQRVNPLSVALRFPFSVMGCSVAPSLTDGDGLACGMASSHDKMMTGLRSAWATVVELQDYHKLRAWKKAHDLAVNTQRLAKSFPRGYGSLRSQLIRSAESVPFTMVEGCGAATPNEFARFLDMSIKSLSEVEEQLEMAKDYGIVTQNDWRTHTEEVQVIRKMTWSLREKVLGNGLSTSSSDGTTEQPKTDSRKRNATDNGITRSEAPFDERG